MKVRFFYQHFWPDSPPYASMLRTIGRHLVTSGNHVRVVTGQPSYKATDRAVREARTDTLHGIGVRRLSSLPGASAVAGVRMLQKALFPIRAALHLVLRHVGGNTDDVIVAATIPPVVNGLCALLAARATGARFVYHMQDIYPEIGTVGGLWSETSLRYRVLRALDTMVASRADKCVVLSADMREALLERGVSKETITIINNIMLDASGGESSQDLTGVKPIGNETAPRRVVFAGNLGRFQGLENVLAGYRRYRDTTQAVNPLELHFLGDGAARNQLIAQAGDLAGVVFSDHLPFDEAARYISDCDAGIVSIAPGVYRYAYPSKTMTYLGLGVPLLVVVEPESSLAREVSEHDLGIVSGRGPGPVAEAFEQLAQWLDTSAADPERLLAHHERAFSTESTLSRWTRLFEELDGPTTTRGSSS